MKRTFAKGAVFGAIASTLLVVATTALAGTGIGAVFNLGRTNAVNAQSTLKGSASGRILQLSNSGSGSALGIKVRAGHAPMAVNSDVKVKHLNADKLDGVDSRGFIRGTGKVSHAAASIPPPASGDAEGPLLALPGAELIGVCHLAGTEAQARIELKSHENGLLLWWQSRDGDRFQKLAQDATQSLAGTNVGLMVTLQYERTNGSITSATVTMLQVDDVSSGQPCEFTAQRVTG